MRGIQGTTPFSVGQWYYVVGTYDGVDVKIYVNGKLEGSTPSNGPIKQTPYDIGIASCYGDEWRSGAHAIIDEVKIYNRALTAIEVSSRAAIPNIQFYNATLSGSQVNRLFGDSLNETVPVQGLIGWWVPQQPTNNTLIDFSNHNNGTLQGVPEWTEIYAEASLTILKGYSFKEISQVEYRLSVNSTSSLFLVLNQNFDPQWVAYINGKEANNHSSSSLGMNQWYVTQHGRLNVTFYFEPQTTVELGIPVSVCSLLIASILVCMEATRKHCGYKPNHLHTPKRELEDRNNTTYKRNRNTPSKLKFKIKDALSRIKGAIRYQVIQLR